MIIVVEMLRPIRSIRDRKGVISDLLNYAIVDQITDQDSGIPVDIGLLLELGQLLLKLIKACQLGSDFVLLIHF